MFQLIFMLSAVVLSLSFSMTDSLWKNFSAPFQTFLLSRNSFVVQFHLNISFRLTYQAHTKISVLIIRILDCSVFSVKILFLNFIFDIIVLLKFFVIK